jgi:acetyltransferase-like isoleucine patch superfamily enzyme
MRREWYRLCGMQVGPRTSVGRISVNWPHLVRLWNCRVESGVIFEIDAASAKERAIIVNEGTQVGRNCEFNISRGITIGPSCLIASGCKFVDHEHVVQPIGQRIFLKGQEEEIVIGENAWLGNNVIVLKGVQIGDGAIVAAGAVVTRSIPANEIWGGAPARKLSQRPDADG